MKGYFSMMLAVVLTLAAAASAEAQSSYVYRYGYDYPPYPAVYPYYLNYTTGNVPYMPYGPRGIFAPAEPFGFGPYYRW